MNTGWRRCIGCLNLQVSFRKRATKYRALSRKMTSKDKASYASSPPCMAGKLSSCDPQTSLEWLWLVGSLKTYVSFAEFSLFHRALLQKRPMFLGSPQTPSSKLNMTELLWSCDLESPRAAISMSFDHHISCSSWWGQSSISILTHFYTYCLFPFFCRHTLDIHASWRHTLDGECMYIYIYVCIYMYVYIYIYM